MDGRYLIYNDFEKDIYSLFSPLITKFNFRLEGVTDCGFDLVNDNCKLNFSKEISLIIWFFDSEYPDGILLYYLCEKKYHKLLPEFSDIIFSPHTSLLFKNLAIFMSEHFSDLFIKDNNLV